MPRRSSRSLRCPICRKLVLSTEPDYPFCSPRCRLIDLGKWASGAYVISSPLKAADQYGEAYTAGTQPAPSALASSQRPADGKGKERCEPRRKRS